MSYPFFVILHNKPWRRSLIAFLALLTLLASIVWWGKDYFEGQGPLGQSLTVIIPKGTRFDAIAQQLATQRIIRYPRLFEACVLLSGNGRNFKAGEYRFPALISPRAVMEALLQGKTVIHQFTVPEGWSSAEITSALALETTMTGDAPWSIPEGSLLPETYNFSYGDDRAGMVARMQKAMERTLAKLWPARDTGLPFSSPREALVLASVVEKETGVKEERGKVAAVFINRMRLGMKLQSDPTVIYALTSGVQKMNRPLNHDDLSIGSAYNTYKAEGLPPGPICNPGVESLKAVLNPPKSDDLFFVASGNGGHSFARTLREHNTNINRYRALLRERQ